jgi:hypothetical protein
MPAVETPLTDDELDAAILAAVVDLAAATGDELVSWAVVRWRVPGDDDRKLARFTTMLCDGRLYALKAHGRNYVGLGDEVEQELAAANRAAGRVRSVRCL